MKISDVVPNLQNFILASAHLLPANLNKIIVFESYAGGEAKLAAI